MFMAWQKESRTMSNKNYGPKMILTIRFADSGEIAYGIPPHQVHLGQGPGEEHYANLDDFIVAEWGIGQDADLPEIERMAELYHQAQAGYYGFADIDTYFASLKWATSMARENDADQATYLDQAANSLNDAEKGDTYKIVRFYQNRTIMTGLTLAEAKEHCNDPSTCREGEWFDGFTKENAE